MEGRVNRARYFGRTLAITAAIVLVALVSGAFLGLTMGSNGQQLAGTVGFIIGLAGQILCAFQVVQRLHDLDKPGTHYWLLLVPFYNIYLSLCLLFSKGTEGPNHYGEDPLTAPPIAIAAGV
ncbi:MAG: DUF805 domain-containing protein [Bryobacteraceae bacterium]